MRRTLLLVLVGLFACGKTPTSVQVSYSTAADLINAMARKGVSCSEYKPSASLETAKASNPALVEEGSCKISGHTVEVDLFNGNPSFPPGTTPPKHLMGSNWRLTSPDLYTLEKAQQALGGFLY